MSGVVGASYRRKRLKRRAYELVGNYRYSRPGLNGLDEKIERCMVDAGIRRGFFIEAGANDGFSQSNTYYLARKHKWTGLLIEPIPELADHCARIRPESRVLRYALGPKEAEGSSVTIHRAGLMSTIEGALPDERQGAHLERARELQGDLVDEPIEVPIRSLSSLLDEHAAGRTVDLFSLDVEGFEPQALAGLDLSRHAPRFICVEANDRDAVDAMLRERYELAAELSHHDRLYRLRDR